MTRHEEGDISVALPLDAYQHEPTEYVLVLNKYDLHAECVLVTRRIDLAIQRDIILETADSGMDGEIVIHTLTSCMIPYRRISTPVGHCNDDVLQEVIDTRYSYPSGRYRTGKRLLPIGDHRERRLKEIYSTFDERFSEPTRTTVPGELSTNDASEAKEAQTPRDLFEELGALIATDPSIVQNPKYRTLRGHMLLAETSYDMQLEKLIPVDADLVFKIGYEPIFEDDSMNSTVKAN